MQRWSYFVRVCALTLAKTACTEQAPKGMHATAHGAVTVEKPSNRRPSKYDRSRRAGEDEFILPQCRAVPTFQESRREKSRPSSNSAARSCTSFPGSRNTALPSFWKNPPGLGNILAGRSRARRRVEVDLGGKVYSESEVAL